MPVFSRKQRRSRFNVLFTSITNPAELKIMWITLSISRSTPATGRFLFCFFVLCQMHQSGPFLGVRRVIDISGDGPNNRGRAVTLAEPELDRYYYDNVIGAGAFMVPARNYDNFAGAILKKLITEVAGAAPNKSSWGVKRTSQIGP